MYVVGVLVERGEDVEGASCYGLCCRVCGVKRMRAFPKLLLPWRR